MRNKAAKFVRLVTTTSAGVIPINHHVLRKPAEAGWQRAKLYPNSVLITCNYMFRDEKCEWSNHIKGFCHPFKTCVLPKDRPHFLFSESDFCDSLLTPVTKTKQIRGFDFAYFTINSMQGIFCKGLHTLRAMDKAAQLAGLRGLVVNYGPPEEKIDGPTGSAEHLLHTVRSEFSDLHNLKIVHRNMNPQAVSNVMKSVKFTMFPNSKDASPRLLTEALVRNCPVLVNSSIYGGWKYINGNTGAFFECPPLKSFCDPGLREEAEAILVKELAEAMGKMVSQKWSDVASAFYSEWGFANASTTLAKIINKVSGTAYERVCYEEHQQFLTRSRRT